MIDVSAGQLAIAAATGVLGLIIGHSLRIRERAWERTYDEKRKALTEFAEAFWAAFEAAGAGLELREIMAAPVPPGKTEVRFELQRIDVIRGLAEKSVGQFPPPEIPPIATCMKLSVDELRAITNKAAPAVAEAIARHMKENMRELSRTRVRCVLYARNAEAIGMAVAAAESAKVEVFEGNVDAPSTRLKWGAIIADVMDDLRADLNTSARGFRAATRQVKQTPD